jgi:CubicO group peptidase (beta-lactamase class C family)
MDHTEAERRGPSAGRARGYVRTDDGFELQEQTTEDVVGAGDLVSTVDDLAKWDEALDDDRFLPEMLRQAMFSPHVALEGSQTGLIPGERGDMGYAWFLRTSGQGRRHPSHAGSGAGFHALHCRLPQDDLVIVVLSNVNVPRPPWIRELVDAIEKALTPPAIER